MSRSCFEARGLGRQRQLERAAAMAVCRSEEDCQNRILVALVPEQTHLGLEPRTWRHHDQEAASGCERALHSRAGVDWVFGGRVECRHCLKDALVSPTEQSKSLSRSLKLSKDRDLQARSLDSGLDEVWRETTVQPCWIGRGC